MRKRFHSEPRSSIPVRLELFEDRCLLSVANALLTGALFPPRLLEPPSAVTHALTPVAVHTDNLIEATGQTGASRPSGTGTASSGSDPNSPLRPTLASSTGPSASSGSESIAIAFHSSIPLVVASSIGLTGGIGVSLPGTIGSASIASLQASLGAQVGPIAIVGVSTTPAANLGVGVDLKSSDAGGAQVNVGIASTALLSSGIESFASVNVALDPTTSPNVGVKLDAGLPQADRVNVVARVNVGDGGSQGSQPPENGTSQLGSAQLTVNSGGGPASSAGLAVKENIDVGLGGSQRPIGGRSVNNVLGGVQGRSLQGNADTSRGVGTNGGMGWLGTHSSTDVQGVASSTEANPDTEISFRADDESHNSGIQEPQRLDLILETILGNTPSIALLTWSTSIRREIPGDLANEAQASQPGDVDKPAALAQAALNDGPSGSDEDSPLASPHRHGLLTDLLPIDLASLEGNIQAFLQQIEELGGELSSLLARLELSPVLLAIAVAAIAGEVARRRLQGSHRGPLLAACEGATLAWFPVLTGPWSPKEP